jgi:UDP-N-acetylglucosamine 2-epimerase (non-hydrolysing)
VEAVLTHAGEAGGRPRVLTVFGVRPEAVKMAPVLKALAAEPRLESALAVTAQHREMLDQVLDHFGLRPDYDLDIMRPSQSLTDIATASLRGLEPVLEAVRPDVVLVHGDTSTTFFATLAAFYQKVPVGHVEAGLRTGNLYSPFPEEANRLLTDALCRLHFAPTARARQNLLAQGVRPDGVFVTGNTAVDALLSTVRADHRFARPEVAAAVAAAAAGRPLVLAELHRRENWGAPMRQVLLGIRDAMEDLPEALLLFSVHRNPAVQAVVSEVLGDHERTVRLDPMPYADWANLQARAHVIVADSGGIQEEAPSLGVRVLLARTETERPEAIEAGTVVAVGVERRRVHEALVAEVRRRARDGPLSVRNPYGDGQAAGRIVAALCHAFGMDPARPADYDPDRAPTAPGTAPRT